MNVLVKGISKEKGMSKDRISKGIWFRDIRFQIVNKIRK